ncbi:MAG: YdcF family protein [Candidatus Peribacteraceae bacterium]|nr:YdcF family protein [Candidatus Peribacteraceae bacterium]MBP9850121.1 YdcF family protein [Candidatus Peribacteraceae bacterium]
MVQETQSTNHHVIVSLGAGLEHRTPSAPPREWIGHQTKLRAEAAATLWKKNPQSLVIFSGGRTSEHSPSEAEAMKDYVCHAPWNIPADSVITDNDSLETAANVRCTVALLRERGIATTDITLVAGRRHLRRATRYFRAYGIRVVSRSACSILGMAPEYVAPRDRSHEILLRVLQLIDRKGRLPTWMKRKKRNV